MTRKSSLLRLALFISIFALASVVSYLLLHSTYEHTLPTNNNNPLNIRGSSDLSSVNQGTIPVVKAEADGQGYRIESLLPGTTPKTSIASGARKKIAYAITVTKDGNFLDGALVLGFSAKKVHSRKYGFSSAYDADLVAFVTSSVVTSRAALVANGWRVLERPLPVTLDEIENERYMLNMKNSGCCGADEFLKLWAYSLTEYHRVVHLDMDSVVLQNMDEIYAIDKEMLFTGDYNMQGRSPAVPAQGGFLVVRPSSERFEELQAIIRKGDFGPKGWGGSGIGVFWGGTTIQGIVPYFYYSVHPGEALEMNRCEYNFMADNPYRPNTLECLDKKPTCQDCRLQDPELVKSAHFTICQKPWTCTGFDNPKNDVPCKAMHTKWFALRDEFERAVGISPAYRVAGPGHIQSVTQGMCKAFGERGYIPIPVRSASVQALY